MTEDARRIAHRRKIEADPIADDDVDAELQLEQMRSETDRL